MLSGGVAAVVVFRSIVSALVMSAEGGLGGGLTLGRLAVVTRVCSGKVVAGVSWGERWWLNMYSLIVTKSLVEVAQFKDYSDKII